MYTAASGILHYWTLRFPFDGQGLRGVGRSHVTRTRDPVALEVFKNALEGVTDGMALTLYRTSRSSIVRHGLDFSTALLMPDAELVAQGFCLPGHLGTMPVALEGCLNHYRERVKPGDILINNDPYEGGSHLPDLILFKPLYAEDMLLGYACAMAHHTDMGGRVAGSVACDSTEIYQEGLRIPPLKLYEEGVPNETIFRLLEKAVRVPEKVLGDISAQVSALNYAERHILGLVNQYGIEPFVQAQQELLDYTEERTRHAIRAFPDGQWTFTDYIDDDGFDATPIPVVATVTKNGDQLHIDFTGTGPQGKGALHPPWSTTVATVFAVVKTVLGADIPNTGGCLRPVTVTAPKGCFVNPIPHAPVGSPGIAYLRMAHALYGAFAQMLPDQIFACAGGCEFLVTFAGYDANKAPQHAWILVDVFNDEAVGGYPYEDGKDAAHSPLVNGTNVPAEILEIEQPLMIEEWGLLPDTEGAGKFRGGVGMVRQFRVLQDETLAQVRSDRTKRPPYGLYGGHSAGPSRIILNPSRTDERRMPSKFVTSLKQGDVMRVETPGAGGWGSPLEREPQLTLQDFIEEKISVQRAREVYGVVVDAPARQVDLEATRKLREGLQQQR